MENENIVLTSWTALPVWDLNTIFNKVEQIPPKIAGFPNSFQVFRFRDAAMNAAYATSTGSSLTVASFGSVIVLEDQAILIKEAERVYESTRAHANGRLHARK